MEETKRYFEESFKFICNYKNLGEKNIISAVVHLDEGAPHMHLMFVPVVHTKDKEGKDIDKICARDFWKGRDSYRKLQDAYFNHVKSKGFDLERGMFIEDTGREHYTIEEYKKITNFDKTKEQLQNMKLELPDVPDITDIHINRLSKKRDEKILEDIIKPKDKLINELYRDNLFMQQMLLRNTKLVEKAEKYQYERVQIMSDNRDLHNEIENMRKEYKEKEFDLEWKYTNKINNLEEENSHLHNIIDRFYKTIDKFIEWVTKKISFGDSKELVKKFENDTNISLDPEHQIKKEEREKEWDLEI